MPPFTLDKSFDQIDIPPKTSQAGAVYALHRRAFGHFNDLGFFGVTPP
jgi:hypothetical protein